MKFVIGGSTGTLGTALVRLGLAHPAITSVVALGRRETQVPPGASNAHKLRSVNVDDFTKYSDNVKKEVEVADICVW
jgi:N-acetyl-gamma-glutamylphosphate reductase